MHIITLTKQMAKYSSSSAPQGDGAPEFEIVTTRDALIAAIRAELIEHFDGTGVQGLVQLEAETIAAFAIGRLNSGHRS